MAGKVTMTVRGEELVRRMLMPEVLGSWVRDALNRVAVVLRNDAVTHAPVEFGRLRASVTWRIDAAVIPTFAVVGTNVLYARPLDAPRTRDPRYRAGPFKGSRTAGWLTDAYKRRRGEVDRALRAVEREVAAWWRRAGGL